MTTDEQYMKIALGEAKRAYEADEVPVGAVVVQENTIMGRGFNQVEMLKDPTAHAEMLALTAAFSFLGSKYLPGATIYVTVEPCHMCAGALYWSKIGRIVYGAPDARHGYRRFLEGARITGIDKSAPSPFHPKTQVLSGILEQDCADLMISFFQSKR